MNAHSGSDPAPLASGEVPVLMYHSIATGTASRRFRRFVMDPGEFAAQMDYLHAEGYCPITAADLAASHSTGHPLPGRPVVLTFDDAYADFYTVALPVLRTHGFRATLYVPTAHVGGTARWMAPIGEGHRRILSWHALRDVLAEGVEVAAHSHTHSQLDRVPAEIVSDEIHRPKRLLEDNLAVGVNGFAYPYGYWNRTAHASVAIAGYRYACVVADLITTLRDDVLALPRLTVRAGGGVHGLARLLRARPTASRRQVSAAKRLASLMLRRGVPVIGGDPRAGSSS